MQAIIKIALGVALLVAATRLTVRPYIRLVERARNRNGSAEPLPQDRPAITLRVVLTLLVGAGGGLVVGKTSVGSGSLATIADARPPDLAYTGSAAPLLELWIALRASVRSVLDTVTLADLAAGALPEEVRRLAGPAEAWQNP